MSVKDWAVIKEFYCISHPPFFRANIHFEYVYTTLRLSYLEWGLHKCCISCLEVVTTIRGGASYWNHRTKPSAHVRSTGTLS